MVYYRILIVNYLKGGIAVKIYDLIAYSGIIAVASLVTTFALGLMRANIELHELFAVITLVFVAIHGGLFVYTKLRKR